MTEVRRVGDAEDWLQEEAEPPPRPWYENIDRRVIVGVVVAIALLLAILAAAGVFSSGGGSSSPPADTTVPTTPATTPAPTTPRAKPAAAPPTTTLKPGDTGAQVKTLQRALASLGYSPGKIDGQYGPATEAAVKKFQEAKKLTVDGIVGAETLKALKTSLQGA